MIAHKHLLIVDENLKARERLSHILIDAGRSDSVVATGMASAWGKLRARQKAGGKFDVALVKMSDLSAISYFVGRVMSDPYHSEIRIFVMYTAKQKKDLPQLFSFGIAGALPMPMKEHKLLKVLDSLLFELNKAG